MDDPYDNSLWTHRRKIDNVHRARSNKENLSQGTTQLDLEPTESRNSKMRHLRRKLIGYLILFFVYGYIAFCVVGILFDYPNSINAFYQPQGKSSLPIAMAYPPISNGQLQKEWFQVGFNLETVTNNPIAESVNLMLTNATGIAFINMNDVNNNITSGFNVTNVWIGFQYAQPWSYWAIGNIVSGKYQVSYFTALDGDWLIADHNETSWYPPEPLPNQTQQGVFPLKPHQVMTFYFPSSGDYSPSIIVALDNGTLLSYSYDQIKVHVLSNADLQALKFSRIDIAVTVSLLLFAGVEGISLVNSLGEKRKNDHSVMNWPWE